MLCLQVTWSCPKQEIVRNVWTFSFCCSSFPCGLKSLQKLQSSFTDAGDQQYPSHEEILQAPVSPYLLVLAENAPSKVFFPLRSPQMCLKEIELHRKLGRVGSWSTKSPRFQMPKVSMTAQQVIGKRPCVSARACPILQMCIVPGWKKERHSFAGFRESM